jgi:hypothetical protein
LQESDLSTTFIDSRSSGVMFFSSDGLGMALSTKSKKIGAGYQAPVK